MTTFSSQSGRASNAVGTGPSSHRWAAISRWYFTVVLLLLYIITFLYWKYFPSRAAFVYVGIISAGLMAGGMVWAKRRGYFANRVDLAVHGYVILDVLLEGIMYEVFRGIGGSSSAANGFVHQFHDNNNFFFCALTFAILIGGNRWYALRFDQAKRIIDRDRSEVEITREETAVVVG